jgi:hypothetical protein
MYSKFPRPTVDEAAKVEDLKGFVSTSNIDGASKVRHQMWVHYVMFNFLLNAELGDPVRLRGPTLTATGDG